MSKRKVFSPDEDEVLIEAVKKFPAIYVADHKDYKSTQTKENIWQLVAEVVGESKCAADCKKRWRDIRDNYYKIRRRGVGTGSTSSTRPPKWPLYELLNFLDSTHKEKKSPLTISNEELTSQQRPVKGEEEDNDTLDSFLTSPVRGQLENSATSMKRKRLRNDAPTYNSKQTSTPFNSISNNFALAKVIESFESRCSQCLEKLTGMAKNEEDDVDVFFRSIALTVKRLPPHLLAKAKLNVLSAVTELEMTASAMNTTPLS